MKFGNGNYNYELVENWCKLPEHDYFKDVCGLGIDSKDNVYTFNRGTYPVMIFDRAGNLVKKWGEGLFKNLHNGCIGPDNCLYCADADSHTVSKYTNDGKLLLQMGDKDKPSDTGFTVPPGATLTSALDTIKRSAPPFNCPTHAALSPSGDIYISDGYGNTRVHVFSPDGKLKFSWGEPGRGPGQFRVAHGIWVDKHERVWVADRQNNRIQIFDAKGKFIDQWIDFILPCSLFIDNDDTVYVAELSRRVSILDKHGKLVVCITDQEQDNEKALLLAPHSITVDSHGDIYAGDVAVTKGKYNRRGRTVQKFARV
jgi:DNA-binding beta-propeller fold protein YncE